MKDFSRITQGSKKHQRRVIKGTYFLGLEADKVNTRAANHTGSPGVDKTQYHQQLPISRVLEKHVGAAS